METLVEESENCPICMSAMGPYINLEDEIALLPCRHKYHNTCISEWIQTATSCPYCRTDFQRIDVLHDLEGPMIRSYTVEPKIQEEQFSEEEEDEEDINATARDLFSVGVGAGCQICASHAREDILMVCDYCDCCYHSFCLGRDGVPTTGPFFCPKCLDMGVNTQAADESTSVVRTVASLRRTSRRSRRTTRRQHDRAAFQYDSWRAAWERVASRAWTRLNAELEYQYEPEAGLTAEQEDELRSWRIRMDRRPNVRASTPVIDAAVVHDPQTASLWAAFEQAKNLSTSSGPSSRRSPSRELPESSASAPILIPEDLPPQKQKRPGAKRRNIADQENGESSKTRKRSGTLSRDRKGSEAGFLSSLLQTIKEPKVEESPVNITSTSRINPGRSRPMSPASPVSPTSPVSPMTPVSPTSPSPVSPTSRSPSPTFPSHSRQAPPHIHTTRPRASGPSRSPSPQFSKLDISKLVSSQLKPLYKVKLTKEEFTDINRTVTRRLFEDCQVVNGDGDISERIGKEIETEIARCHMIA